MAFPFYARALGYSDHSYNTPKVSKSVGVLYEHDLPSLGTWYAREKCRSQSEDSVPGGTVSSSLVKMGREKAADNQTADSGCGSNGPYPCHSKKELTLVR